jgi:hypothetical protein
LLIYLLKTGKECRALGFPDGLGAFIDSRVVYGDGAVDLVKQLCENFSGFKEERVVVEGRGIFVSLFKEVILNSCAVKLVDQLYHQLEYCSKDIDQLPGVTVGVNDVEARASWLCDRKIFSFEEVKSADKSKLRVSCIHACEVIRQSLGWRVLSFE